MTDFKSPMSTEVKAITLLGSAVLLSIGITLFILSGLLWLKILIILAVLISFYFLLTTSLRKVTIDKNHLILNYRIGRRKIDLNEITEISRIKIDNLTMTYGSRGIFGYNGDLIESSDAYVNDRKKMLKIRTKEKDYIISINNPDLMIKLITENQSSFIPDSREKMIKNN